MNTKLFWRKFFQKQAALLVMYVLLLLLAWLISLLYGQPAAMAGDLLRYSLPFLLIYLAADFFWCRKQVKQIADWDGTGGQAAVSPGETAFEEKARLLASRHRQDLAAKELEEKEAVEQMELLAHEIKNSLTELTSLCSQGDQVPSAKLRQPLVQADYQLNLLLNGQRLAASQHDFDFEWVNLASLVNEVLRQNMASFLEKKTVPRLEMEPVALLTDRKWLRFIIQQYLSNALKYGTGPEIVISFQGQTLTVHNQGPEIRPADLVRVFDKGFTGVNGHRSQQSTGMGLYFVKQAAGQLGLSARLASENGGVSARLTFPGDRVKYLTKS